MLEERIEKNALRGVTVLTNFTAERTPLALKVTHVLDCPPEIHYSFQAFTGALRRDSLSFQRSVLGNVFSELFLELKRALFLLSIA